MAQATQVPIFKPGDGRFWNDGWDGYPAARSRLFDALSSSGAANPVALSGDVHTFYASELRSDFNRPVSRQNPVIATEFCGTSVTSNSRPQTRTRQFVDMNPHIRYGRSDKRGFIMLNISPTETKAAFMALDDVRNPQSAVAAIANFTVANGRPGASRA